MLLITEKISCKIYIRIAATDLRRVKSIIYMGNNNYIPIIRKSISILTLITIDMICLLFAVLLTCGTQTLLTTVKPVIHEYAITRYDVLSLWWVPVIFILFICYERLYTRRLPVWDGMRELLKSITTATILLLAIMTLAKSGEKYSRLTILIMYVYSIVLFPVFRVFGKRMLFKLNIWKEKVIILGAGHSGVAIAKGILENTHLGYQIVGFFDDDKDKIGKCFQVAGEKYKVFGRIRQFRHFIRRLDVSTVIVSMPSLDIERMGYITNNVQKFAKNILLVPELKGISLANTELYHLFNQKMFMLRIKNNLKSRFNQTSKKIFDYTISILLLPFIFPLIVLLGLLIKLDSSGPVFFTHTRIGRNGKPIRVYKFRTMYKDAKERLEKILNSDPAAREEWETYYKLKDDPRVTKIGDFLRKTSLDELAQIFNVLKGEMSLVGPRPVLNDEIVKYYKEDKDYYFLTKPGITGLWQVSGRNDIDYEDRVRLDTWYALNWSLWLDIVILLKTVKVVFAREGAY